MTLEEAIIHEEEVAEENEKNAKSYPRPDKSVKGSGRKYNACIKCAAEHRQRAEWLRELKERREIQDILLQFIVDEEYEVCCDELAEDEKEWEICEKNCNNQTKECWLRWAKMKTREVTADDRNSN